ncbi:MAG: Hpt domain-containing protein, partial [Oscillospiraceae bacterium]
KLHTFKGMIANFGFKTLYELCDTMVRDLREYRNNLQSEFDCITNEYKRLIEIINNYIISAD